MDMPEFNIRCIVPSAETGGLLAIFEEIDPPGLGPPLHAHREQTEIFHVISGEYQFVIGADRKTLGPGDAVAVPPGAPHTFKNIGNSNGRLHFELAPPGKAEEFFNRLVREAGAIEDMEAFFNEYGMDLIGPPLE